MTKVLPNGYIAKCKTCKLEAPVVSGPLSSGNKQTKSYKVECPKCENDGRVVLTTDNEVTSNSKTGIGGSFNLLNLSKTE